MSIIHLENSKLTADIDTFGAKVLSLKGTDGFEILQSFDPKEDPADNVSLFPLLPICNRVKGSAYELDGQTIALPLNCRAHEYLHGDGWVSAWQIDSKEAAAASLSLAISHDSGYAYRAEFKLSLIDNQAVFELKVTHEGLKPRLYGLGLHPYFALDDTLRLKFCASGFYPDGPGHLSLPFEKHIPDDQDFSKEKAVPNLFLNQLYAQASAAVITRQNRTIRMASRNCGHLMLYHVPNGRFIALEPVMHLVDAPHQKDFGGLKLLKNGESVCISTAISLE